MANKLAVTPNLTLVSFYVPEGTKVLGSPELLFLCGNEEKVINPMYFPEHLLPVLDEIIEFTEEVYKKNRKLEELSYQEELLEVRKKIELLQKEEARLQSLF